MTRPALDPKPWWRRRPAWLNSNTVLIVAFVAQSVALGGVVDTGRRLIDELANQRDTDLVATCDRGNVTREQINDGLYAANSARIAVDDLADAAASQRAATLGLREAMIAALTPAGGLDEDGQARADALRAATDAQLAVVDAGIASARAQADAAEDALETALLSLRDCTRILDDPNAEQPPPTLPPEG